MRTTKKKLGELVKEAQGQNSLEPIFAEEGLTRIIGVDEVGRGPLAGPVTAGAVSFTLPFGSLAWEDKVRDSKKMSAHQRETLFDRIREASTSWVAHCDSSHIDEHGIQHANDWAMTQAVLHVADELDGPPDLILIDGTRVPWQLQMDPETRIIALKKADHRSLHVAAASILAKVVRDEKMVEEAAIWPEYGFESNKGYGTKAHREAVEEYGPSPIHRLTFGCVKEHADRVRELP